MNDKLFFTTDFDPPEIESVFEVDVFGLKMQLVAINGLPEGFWDLVDAEKAKLIVGNPSFRWAYVDQAVKKSKGTE